jgi:two-component system chemotaxis sensor kinase CheA
MELNQYMGMFLEESREHLQTLNSCLLSLENDPRNLSVLDEIFRSAHTIKGMSATMGFTAIAELTHEMENVLDLLRKGQLTASQTIIDTLFKCLDTLEQSVESIASNSETTVDIKPLVAILTKLASGQDKEVSAPPPASTAASPATVVMTTSTGVELNDTETDVVRAANRQGYAAYEVQVGLREGCLLKSARAYMVMNALDELGDVIKSMPPAEELEKENFDFNFTVVALSDSEPEKIQQTLLSISEVETVTVLPLAVAEAVPPAPAAAAPVVEAKDEKPAADAKADSKPDAVHAAAEAPAAAEKKLRGGQSVRVDIDKLDTLLNLVGELVINKTRLEQIGLSHHLVDLTETIEQMDRVTTDLQAVVMKVRMVPVGQVFNRFPRMVRDLSRDLNKEVNLIIQGEETELDRTVID